MGLSLTAYRWLARLARPLVRRKLARQLDTCILATRQQS